MIFLKPLQYTPSELKLKIPASHETLTFIENSRTQITRILNGDDPRVLLIVGPCSIHNSQAGIEYAKKLQALSEDVSSLFFIVMRTYFEKPRTTYGWKGMIYDPHLDGSNDIEYGIIESRKLLMSLSQLKLPAATEFLDPAISLYLKDLISWGCIGARTSESQIHRQLASSLDLPLSFKNGTSGNVDIAINGILSAAQPHTYPGINEQGQMALIQTEGNSNCHITLRGSDFKSNYDPESICLTLESLEKANLPKRLLIDCSHGNSKPNYLEQCSVFQSVIHQMIEGNRNIRGMILESELSADNQQLPKGDAKPLYGVSITDPCIDFKTTETLIRWAFEKLQKNETLLCKN